MRPVDKGEAPTTEYKRYQDAEPELEERIGAYCSFCEMSIKHVPEVEHREAKVTDGELLKWENLLLSCKYCNTRKGKQVEKGDKEKYLWPDEDDTFHAYLYDRDVPRLNEEYLDRKGVQEKEKASKLFQLLQLDHISIAPKDKDRRYRARNEARNYAIMSKNGLNKMQTSSDQEEYMKMIKNLAQESGFFSVWMEVFKND